MKRTYYLTCWPARKATRSQSASIRNNKTLFFSESLKRVSIWLKVTRNLMLHFIYHFYVCSTQCNETDNLLGSLASWISWHQMKLAACNLCCRTLCSRWAALGLARLSKAAPTAACWASLQDSNHCVNASTVSNWNSPASWNVPITSIERVLQQQTSK